MRIKVTTKFDCTTTGVTGNFRSSQLPLTTSTGLKIHTQEEWNRARNQQRNWETITQLIGLYTQLENITECFKNQDSWEFEFETEFEGVFQCDDDNLGALKNSCTGVPMVTGLNETQIRNCWLDPGQNIWFEQLR